MLLIVEFLVVVDSIEFIYFLLKEVFISKTLLINKVLYLDRSCLVVI